MENTMNTVTTSDGVEIYYKDWGKGQPIVFSHGWPLSADDWDAQMLFFLGKGYRVIAHDRRGHGRSTQVGDGHDMDHYADDLAAVTTHLDLKDAIHVGHSSTVFRHSLLPIARSSTERSPPARSTTTIGRARNPRNPSSRTGGARA
jgi:alpha-beta hydrolase superfamily lysophospholipase